jgi:hypothetical protein
MRSWKRGIEMDDKQQEADMRAKEKDIAWIYTSALG